MRIPNVNIVLRSEKRHSSVKMQPAYYADMYRRVWGGRLDKEHGIETTEIDPRVSLRVRYTEVADVAQAERMVVAYFCHGDEQRRSAVSAAFNEAFPDGLRPVIDKLLREDMVLTRKRIAAASAAPTAHPSFLEAGLTTAQALALQRAGMATVREVNVDDVIQLSECGLDVEALDKLAAAQRPVGTVGAANPLTVATKG